MIIKFEQFLNYKLNEYVESDIVDIEELADIILRPMATWLENFPKEQQEIFRQSLITDFKKDYKKGGNARIIRSFMKQTNNEVKIKSFAPLKFIINDTDPSYKYKYFDEIDNKKSKFKRLY